MDSLEFTSPRRLCSQALSVRIFPETDQYFPCENLKARIGQRLRLNDFSYSRCHPTHRCHHDPIERRLSSSCRKRRSSIGGGLWVACLRKQGNGIRQAMALKSPLTFNAEPGPRDGLQTFEANQVITNCADAEGAVLDACQCHLNQSQLPSVLATVGKHGLF